MIGQHWDIPFRSQQSGDAVLHRLRDAAMVKAHDGQTHGLRLRKDVAKGLTHPIFQRNAWSAEDPRPLVPCSNLLLRLLTHELTTHVQVPGKALQLGAEGAVSDDNQVSFSSPPLHLLHGA